MIGKVLDNRYELVDFIGKGGMALEGGGRDNISVVLAEVTA